MSRVLITGGGSGIGLAMARAFAGDGAQVCVTDVDAAALAVLPSAIRGERADVADAAAMADLVLRLEADWGGLDVVCANAGIAGPTAPVEAMPLDGWRDCLAVGLDGLFFTVRAVVPGMKRRGAGVILVTVSTSGLYGTPLRSPYTAAKWAAAGLVRTWAMELGRAGIRVNGIAPGAVTGPRIDRVIAAEAAAKGTTPAAIRAGYAAGTALGTLIDPEDIAATALFLASPAAARITGQVIAVDGLTVNPDP